MLQGIGKTRTGQFAVLELVERGEGIDGAVDGEFLPLACQDLLIPAGLTQGAGQLVGEVGMGTGRFVDWAQPGLPLPWRNTKWPLCMAPWLVTPAITGLPGKSATT